MNDSVYLPIVNRACAGAAGRGVPPSSGDRLLTPARPVVLSRAMSATAAFKLESELVATLCSTAQQVLAQRRDRPCTLLREVQIGSNGTRIPDVLMIFPPKTSAVPTSITYYDASILAALLEGTARSPEQLAARLYAPVADVELRVRRLVRRCLVTVNRAGQLRANVAMVPTRSRIVAIEAKLSRWRDAIQQARTYQTFANESYVAMPSHIARRGDVVAACSVAEIGVLAVDPDEVNLVLPATRQQPQGPEWLRLISQTVGIRSQSPVTATNASRQGR